MRRSVHPHASPCCRLVRPGRSEPGRQVTASRIAAPITTQQTSASANATTIPRAAASGSSSICVALDTARAIPMRPERLRRGATGFRRVADPVPVGTRCNDEIARFERTSREPAGGKLCLGPFMVRHRGHPGHGLSVPIGPANKPETCRLVPNQHGTLVARHPGVSGPPPQVRYAAAGAPVARTGAGIK